MTEVEETISVQDALQNCEEALQRMWARKPMSTQRPKRYVVEFVATEDVFKRIADFIKEQPAYKRSYRYYECKEEA